MNCRDCKTELEECDYCGNESWVPGQPIICAESGKHYCDLACFNNAEAEQSKIIK